MPQECLRLFVKTTPALLERPPCRQPGPRLTRPTRVRASVESPGFVASSADSRPPLRSSVFSPSLALLAASHPTGPLPLILTAHYISPASFFTLATSLILPSPARSRARHYSPTYQPARHSRVPPGLLESPHSPMSPRASPRVPEPTLLACQPTRVPLATAREPACRPAASLMAVPHSCLTH